MRLILLAAFLISFSGVVFGQSGEGECNLVKEVKVIHESAPGAGDGSIELIVKNPIDQFQILWMSYNYQNTSQSLKVNNLVEGEYVAFVFSAKHGCSQRIDPIKVN